MHTLPFNFPHSSLWVGAIIFPTSQMLKQRLGRFGWTAWSTQREGLNPAEDSAERMASQCNLHLDSDPVWSQCRHQEVAEQEIFPFLFQPLPLIPSSSSSSSFLFPFPTLYSSLLNLRWGNDLVIQTEGLLPDFGIHNKCSHRWNHLAHLWKFEKHQGES